MDDELKLRNDWAKVEAAFLDAKKKRDKDPDGYKAAKAEMHNMRAHWRGIRDAVAGSVTTTIAAKARSN